MGWDVRGVVGVRLGGVMVGLGWGWDGMMWDDVGLGWGGVGWDGRNGRNGRGLGWDGVGFDEMGSCQTCAKTAQSSRRLSSEQGATGAKREVIHRKAPEAKSW